MADTAKDALRTLKGFRDFLPVEKRSRDYVGRRIVAVFERFGFEPIETPTLEYAALIMGKYGEEADRLVYMFEDQGGRKVALPYDQTVPTARVLARYRNELPRYLRRYAIKNVFRGEKPGRGRYREFTQCDIDLFGSESPLADAEIVACTHAVLRHLGFANVRIKLNDRGSLFAALEPFGDEGVAPESILQSIDKLDKVGIDGVVGELASKGMAPERAREALDRVSAAAPSENLSRIMEAARHLGVPEGDLLHEPTLARGLDYYTGMIVEVTLPDVTIGSVAGGGRYDGLIAQLGGPDVPAVGIAFGFDRLVEAASELGLLPDASRIGVQTLVTVFDEASLPASLELAHRLRDAGLRCEVHPATDKIGKQLKAAHRRGIPTVVVIGPDELDAGKAVVRDMVGGEQQVVPREEVPAVVRGLLGEAGS